MNNNFIRKINSMENSYNGIGKFGDGGENARKSNKYAEAPQLRHVF